MWVYSGEENGAYQFNDELRLYPLALKHPQPASTIDMETLRSQPGMWVLSRAGVNSEVLAALTQGCRQVKSVVSGQFEADAVGGVPAVGNGNWKATFHGD